MNKKLSILGLLLAVLLIGAGCNKPATTTNTNATTNTSSGTTVSQTVTYSGQDGKNALELLQAGHIVEEKDGFVNTIDGIAPVGRQYWAFYVNGTLAQVGAKDYQTKSSDAIEWKLEAY